MPTAVLASGAEGTKIKCPDPACRLTLGELVGGEYVFTIRSRQGGRRGEGGGHRMIRARDVSSITCEGCGAEWRPPAG